MSIFLSLSGISLGQYCQKKSCQKWGFGRKDKKGKWPYIGLSIEGGSNLLYTMLVDNSFFPLSCKCF